MSPISSLIVAAAVAGLVTAQTPFRSTRYWDCCKPSCAWTGKASVKTALKVCSASDSTLSNGADAASGCGGGPGYMCSSDGPIAVSDTLAYGTAAVSFAPEAQTCGSCYALKFDGALAGKTMIVQAINTGGDVSANPVQFDLALPGGGQGIFSGCSAHQYTSFPSSLWGTQYGGISSESACSSLPAALQPGCEFRFGWFKGADNPTGSFTEVDCPAALVARTGLLRSDGKVSGGTGSPSSASSSSTRRPVMTQGSTTSTVRIPTTSTTPRPVTSTTSKTSVVKPVTTAPALSQPSPPASGACLDGVAYNKCRDAINVCVAQNQPNWAGKCPDNCKMC